MEKVLETKFVDVHFDSKSQQMDNRWKETTNMMLTDDFKAVVLEMAETVKKYKPKYMLADTLVYDFTVSPELQVWSGENYFVPAIEGGLQKLAFLVPESIFAEVSIQQMMEEEKALGIKTQYFKEEEKALEWFKG